PSSLDYISLAVPRGFLRPGAVPARARAWLEPARGGEALVTFEADPRGGFEIALPPGHALERAVEGEGALVLVAQEGGGPETRIELAARGHGAHGLSVLRASEDGTVTLTRAPAGGLQLRGFGFREPVWQGPVSH